jgi:lipopolysaccharide biosynthesis protein
MTLDINKKDIHISFYLPQYHEIPENDLFWGKGFTDWHNVKNAEKLFSEHMQPKVPHDYIGYYNLNEKKTLLKQSELAIKYGIDAFCFYSYLFDKDKILLDKPINILLDNPDINQKFCLCWANENWTRSWDGKNEDVLIYQNYSEELLNFFPIYIEKFLVDKRYVRDRNRPLILIYRPENIPNIKNWSIKWRDYFKKKLNVDILLCKVNSFNEKLASRIGFDLNIEFPPNISKPKKIKNYKYHKELNIFDYDFFLNEEFHLKQVKNLLIRSVFPSWDNTARRGKNATIFLNSSPDKFYKYILLCKKFRSEIKDLDNNYLFINSWNEWAEGAQIEPDSINGFGNLISNYISKNFQYKN